MSFLSKIYYISIRINNKVRKLFNSVFYRLTLASYGARSDIKSPLKIDGAWNIFVGQDVIVEYKTWLAALPLTGDHKCELRIGEGSRIGHFNHIYCTKSIVIEKNVLTADKVYISDNLHEYKNPNIPILKQSIIQNNCVIIGEGSWLGENVCVIGASIGKNCVIGANSVVTKDIPDYSVAVGSPARIIRRYDFEMQKWRRTDNNGNFTINN